MRRLFSLSVVLIILGLAAAPARAQSSPTGTSNDQFWRDKWKDNVLGKGFDSPHLIRVFRYELVTLKDAINEVTIENGEIERGDPQTLRQERAPFGLACRPMQSVVLAWRSSSINGWRATCSCSPVDSPNVSTQAFWRVWRSDSEWSRG
jgi:hypothetical protein